MERIDRAVTTLFWESPLHPGEEIVVSGPPAHHAHVRRTRRGDALRLLDGAGHVATCTVSAVDAKQLIVSVQDVVDVPRPAVLDVIAPIADRERMLIAAEKCAELQVTSWQSVLFERSRSVSPRGEGPRFADRLRARMQSALEQSGGAWMPDIHPDSEWPNAVQRGAQRRILLDVRGTPLPSLIGGEPTMIAVGPEGGLVDEEIDAALRSGWVLGALAATTLRFETALLAAAGVVRAMQLTSRSM